MDIIKTRPKHDMYAEQMSRIHIEGTHKNSHSNGKGIIQNSKIQDPSIKRFLTIADS
jgi:hypothetical protein